MNLYTHLNFGGNCDEAFRFYEKHLGGRIVMMMRQDEAPNAPPGAGKAVIHAQMEIADTVLIGNDVPAANFQPMRSAYLYLSVESTEKAKSIHKLLAEGGQIFMDLGETFYATHFVMLRDRFDVSWTIIHERPRA
ncbi:MAG: VOC family protein [Gemmatimonadaceae bacterium]